MPIAVGMQVVESVERMQRACKAARRTGRLGLVPTMGALHEGHLSLVRAARRECDVVAASIFVNPAQFGPNEDFERYPRTFEADCALLEQEGVDLLFAPSAAEMYPRGMGQVIVDVPEVGARLDGRFREGHFRGVATVVTKLLHIVGPDAAFFGQKDAAQVAVLRAMMRELNFAGQMVVCPTVRESDGLAMSSRNRNLSAVERKQALGIWHGLVAVHALVDGGMHDAGRLRRELVGSLQASDGVQMEYAEIVNADTLLPVADVCEGALVAVAAYVGSTRLIDNVVLPGVAR
jgi:pantoate--beta-alanine ligase